jgi:hypothetical protein
MPASPDNPVVARERKAIAWPMARQAGRLTIGVGGTVGGAVLLATNLLPVVSGVGVAHWVPLAANAALIFGGAMFLREYRRGATARREASDR